MLTDTIDATKVLRSIDSLSLELLDLVNPLNEKTINAVPFKDSWTAAQLLSHVTKSTKSITQAFSLESKKVNRDPGEGIEKIRAMFLDYKKKYNSPDFILPKQDSYEKDVVINDYKNSVAMLKKVSAEVDLTEAISHPAFGEVTKYELLHFVEVHTQRHIHELKKIIKALKN